MSLWEFLISPIISSICNIKYSCLFLFLNQLQTVYLGFFWSKMKKVILLNFFQSLVCSFTTQIFLAIFLIFFCFYIGKVYDFYIKKSNTFAICCVYRLSLDIKKENVKVLWNILCITETTSVIEPVEK